MDYPLELKNISISFYSAQGEVQAVREVSLSLQRGEILALVGESGCGKTVLCKAAMGLLPKSGKVKQGQILANGVDIAQYAEKKLQKLRGNFFSMVFQDPMASLNPTIPVGKQIVEAVLKHRKVSREDAKRQAVAMMDLVGIDDSIHRYRLQPHYFSGGMRQRCVLAIALAAQPQVLFADEPTTALDVTVQAKILDLMQSLVKKMELSTIFITHDLGVVARIADRVAVMYAGKIVEIGTAEEIFYDPRHPYTWGLLQSLPYFAQKTGKLHSIPGMPPVLIDPPPGDLFAYRNEYAMKIDYEEMPPMFSVSKTHQAATWLLDSRAPQIKPPFQKERG